MKFIESAVAIEGTLKVAFAVYPVLTGSSMTPTSSIQGYEKNQWGMKKTRSD